MILKNCRLVPELCEDITKEEADIRLEGELIAEILPPGGTYMGEEVLDLKGKTVIPGLFNNHTHIDQEDSEMGTPLMSDVQRYQAVAIKQLNLYLAYGFTTIRDAGCTNFISSRLRDMINEGLMIGPNLQGCGDIIMPDFFVGSYLEYYSNCVGFAIEGPHNIPKVFRHQIANGADFIKIMGDYAMRKNTVERGPHSDSDIVWTDEEIETMIKTVNHLGTYLSVHSTSEKCNQKFIEAGARILDHGMFLSDANIDAIIANGHKTSIIPTVHWGYVGKWKMDMVTNIYRDSMRKAAEGGVLMGWGTDASLQSFLLMPHAEFVSRASFGFSNIDVIKQATINSAIQCGWESVRGTIKVGKIADLAVYDGKPDKDLEEFSRPCAYVIKGGRVVASHGMIQCTPVSSQMQKTDDERLEFYTSGQDYDNLNEN